ncbi:hypothetical protein SY88_08045 [Clostridiales bacterium PH28_bin88]|nr:hypothetical protein SY88_08045 [Clostridiales bacterium PH28_bin88]
MPENGAIESVNVLSTRALGLLEFAGAPSRPLLRPFLAVNGAALTLNGMLEWDYRNHWVPAFQFKDGNITLMGEIFAPPGVKGFVYRLSLLNTGTYPLEFSLGWEGEWEETRLTVFNSRPVTGASRSYYSGWTKSMVWECRPGLPAAALALGSDDIEAYLDVSPPGFRFTLRREHTLAPGASFDLSLLAAVNAEGDGAATTVVHLRRLGWRRMREDTLAWLKSRSYTCGRPAVDRLLNRNLFFNCFYSVGTTVDTEECAPVTSRSPRYYVSAAFWARDTFLWSFPALLLVDLARARDVLLAGYHRHLKHPGGHSQYINGSLLYPGFELDQLAAYVLALGRYLDAGGDPGILSEDPVRRGLDSILQELDRHRTPYGLYETFLDPADDPVTYPFLVYDQVLVWKALTILDTINQERGWWPHRDFASEAEALRQAVWAHGVAEGPFGPMFAWAVDGIGHYELYDSPPGSLMLLPYYGFCPRDEQVFLNTARWIHSPANPYQGKEGRFTGPGCTHAPGPWVLGMSAALLAGSPELTTDSLAAAPMDNGFACETLDPDTGFARTGLAFATCAGFLATAVHHAMGSRIHQGGES